MSKRSFLNSFSYSASIFSIFDMSGQLFLKQAPMSTSKGLEQDMNKLQEDLQILETDSKACGPMLNDNIED